MNNKLILDELVLDTFLQIEPEKQDSNASFGEKSETLMNAFQNVCGTVPVQQNNGEMPSVNLNIQQGFTAAAPMADQTTPDAMHASALSVASPNNLPVMTAVPEFDRIITKGTFSENMGMDGLYARIDNGFFNGYLYGGSAADDGNVHDTTSFVINNGTFSRVYAGNRINGEWLSISGDSSIVINDGYFKGAVVCGDHILTGAVSRTGNTSIQINGGRFNKIVCGGANLDSTDNLTVSDMTGDINMTIAGGIFRNKIFVGMLSTYLMDSTRLSYTGDVNLTIDTSENEITMLGPNVTIGNSGFISNYGNATIRITGTHAWNYQGRVEASCEAAAKTNTSTDMTGKNAPFSRECCTGKSTVDFDGFIGQLDCYFTLFSDCIFRNGSRIVFTDSRTQWSMIRNWTFEWGCFASGLHTNGFHQDNLTFDLNGWDGNEWKVLEGKESAFLYFNQATSVTIGGESASWNAEEEAWMSDSYRLFLREDTPDSINMIVAAIQQA